MGQTKHRSMFTKDNLIGASTVSLLAGQYNRVGSYKVLAGELVSMGFGGIETQEGATGRIFVDIKDNGGTPAVIAGTIRFSATSALDNWVQTIFESRIEVINQNQTNRTLQLPFPEDDLWVSQDKHIVVDFMPDSAATLSKANSTMLIDITRAEV